MGRLIELLGIRVYIDANVVIYAVEGFAAYERTIRSLLAAMDDGEITAVTSELTLAEVLVKPIRDVNELLVTAYQTFLEPTSALSVIPVDRSVLEEAAAIRAAGTVKLPDAIHLATARRARCTSFLTNDDRLRGGSSLPVVLLEDLAKANS